MTNVLRMHVADNVVNAVVDLPAGTLLDGEDGIGSLEIRTKAEIPFGHKVAIAPIVKGETVTKYGASIGIATVDIDTGEHVHTHNVRSVRGAAQR